MFLIYDQTKNFISKHTSSLIIQSEKNFFSINTINFFDKIFFSFNQNEVIIKFQKKTDTFKYPFNFNDLKERIFYRISNYKISLNKIDYYPIQQKIENQTFSCKLTYTHSLILSNLFLFDQGISKNDLYKKIWPYDKEVSINKIDTHLTNIKNILNQTINFSLKISSKNGLLKLIID